MKLLGVYQDSAYPFTGFHEKREIARAIVSDGHGHYAIHEVVRDDLFGKFDYFETPGGGVDEGETPEVAVVRECREELGYAVKVVQELGVVEDAYNLIKRQNVNHYFLCLRSGEALGTRFVSEGDHYIHQTLWLSIPEIIARYESVKGEKLPSLLYQREVPVWRLAEGIIEAGEAGK